MKYLFTILVIIFAAGGYSRVSAGRLQRHSDVQLMLPEFAIAGKDMQGSCLCTDDNGNRPRVKAIKNDYGYCNSKLELLNGNEQNVNSNQVHFQIENISATCTYKCFIHGSYEIRTVSVVG